MWLQSFARHPRRPAARRAVVPRRGAGAVSSAVSGVSLAARGVLLCVAIHLVHGYALVARVRVEVVPAAAAPPASPPAVCATGVLKW